MTARRADQEGAVLVVVLWALAVMTLALNGALSMLNAGLTLDRTMASNDRAELAVASALETAAERLLTHDDDRRWIADGRSYAAGTGGEWVDVRVWDAGALIDINRADVAVIRSFLLRAGATREAAESLSAVIEEARGGVAIKQAAPVTAVGLDASEQRAVEPRHPFRSVRELASRLRGRDRELLDTVLPYLTAYGRSGGINPGLAPRAVLEAVPDLSRLEAAAILAGRSRGKITGSDASAIVAKNDRFFDGNSNGIYRVDLRALGRAFSAVIILQADEDAPYRLLEWRRGA